MIFRVCKWSCYKSDLLVNHEGKCRETQVKLQRLADGNVPLKGNIFGPTGIRFEAYNCAENMDME